MCRLAAHHPETFWQVLEAYARAAADAGTASGIEQKPLTLAWSWLADDLFLGRSPRLTQARHGRGEVSIQGNFFWRRARLERAPEIWDAHLDQVRALLQDARALPEAGAVAFNVLRSHGQSEVQLLEGMGQAVLERWAAGQVAWARNVALNELARRWGQSAQAQTPSGEAAAKLMIEAGARARRRVQVLVARELEGAGGQWKARFASALQKYLDAVPVVEGVALDLSRWTRRARTAARALFDLVRDSIDDAGLWKYLPLWARFAREAQVAGDGSGFSWLEGRVRNAAGAGKLEHLADIAKLDETERARLGDVFIAGAAGAKIDNAVAQNLLTSYNGATTRLAWRLIAATGPGPSFLRTLFKVLQERYVTDDIGLALYGDEAARLWESCAWSPKDMQAWMEGANAVGYGAWRSPWIRVLPYASARFFLAVLEALATRLNPSEGANIFRARHGLRGILILPEASQDAVVQALSQATWRFEPTQEDLQAMITPNYYARPKSYAGAWRLLASTQVAPELLRATWQSLFSLPIQASAATAAAELWQRAEIEEAEVSPWLQSKNLSSFAPEFLAFLLRRQPALLFESLARVGDEQVEALQVLVREMVADDARRAGFWEGLFPRLRDDAMRPAIEARLLSDAQIFGSFARLGPSVAADFFAKGRDEAQALLLSWLDANEGSLERDDLALLNAAISPLPPVHERGLRRIEALGLTLPLALRLWESLLPPAIAAAQRFAEAMEPGSAEESEVALALCDSPAPQVQAAGREFVAARASRLLSTEMVQKLTEGTNPAMQAWVAGLLNERLASPGSAAPVEESSGEQGREASLEPRDFDRVVLREKRRGRQAKEKVKQRLGRSGEAALEPGVLLEMARGRVARDREWALQQIARLQVAGVEVAGVEVLEPR
jgi:hypothetical protein